MSVRYHDKNYDLDEPILKDTLESDRYVLFPIKYPDLFKMYKMMSSVYWVADEISFSQDLKDLDKLTEDEKHFVFRILAFFSSSDGIVIENLVLSFFDKVKLSEYRNCVCFQLAIEAVHSETYSLLIDTYCRNNESEKKKLFEAIENYPAIANKSKWAQKWIGNDDCSFAQKLVAYVMVEGLFFCGSFCAIYWLKERGLLPGLSFANSLIARDESQHAKLTAMIYQYIENKLPEDLVHDMVREAVEIERSFIIDSLPCRLIGMNSDLMFEYIKYMADWNLVLLGYEKLYNANNPFHFAIYASLEGKVNFFEQRVDSYQRASVKVKNAVESVNECFDKFEITEDF